MKNKVTFAFALIATVLVHIYVLDRAKIKQPIVTVKPQKKVSPIINLQRVVIKQEPVVEPVVDPIVEKEVLPEPPKPVVEVVVVPPKVIKKKAIQKVVKKPKIVKKKVVKKKKKVKKRKVVKKVRKKTKTKQRSVKAQRSSPKTKAVKNAYLAKIRRTIEQRKKYPRAAKRMKQQGTAYVKFTISKNGRIRHIKLSKKCPYAKLNKAAMDILKKIGAFAPIPKELGEQYLSLTIPIKYQILN